MPGPASILILAKKKAAGHGGFFDPMAEHAGMAMGPMMFEMAEEEDEGDEPTPEKASLIPNMSKMDFKSAAAKLREIASQLEGSEPAEEPEPTEEEEMPEPAKVMAGPPKKGPPAFLKPKPMKY